MRTCTKAAAVDNDFVNHLVDCKLKDEELLATIATILSDLKLSTVMHPLVYEKELILKNARVDLLFERQIIPREFQWIPRGQSPPFGGLLPEVRYKLMNPKSSSMRSIKAETAPFCSASCCPRRPHRPARCLQCGSRAGFHCCP